MDSAVAKRFWALVVVAALCMSAVTTLWAQGSGALAGVVTDPNGAVIGNAKMELTNSATGEARSATSTAAGTYRFAPLPVVGTYTLAVEAQGFKKVQVAGIVVTVAAETTRNVTMQVGAVTEVVNVEATAPLVETTQASVSNLVDHLVWQQMPLEDRNQNTFIALGAGVVPNAQAGSTRGAAVNGARGGTGNFLVEGFDANDQGQGGRGAHSTSLNGAGAIISLSPDAIQEFRVITNNFNAEHGRGGGFINETVLKSGTNSWHGSAFWYNRIQALAANDFFSNRAGQQDKLVRNQGGGSLGGPIIKDKAFIFGTVEIHRLRKTVPRTATATTQQFLDFVNSGAFQTFIESSPNGLCNNSAFLDNFFGDGTAGSGGAPAACAGAFVNSGALGPIFSGLAATQPFPLATSNFTNAGASLLTGTPCLVDAAHGGNPACANANDPTVIYPVPVYGDVTISDPFRVNENRFSFKSDVKLTDKDQLTATYAFSDFDSSYGFYGGYSVIGPSFLNPSRSQLAGVAWTRTFTPRVVNQARFSYLRNRSDFPNTTTPAEIPAIITGIDPLQTGFGNGANFPQFFTENQFQWKDDLSIVHGKHSFKVGMEYRRIRNGSSFEATKNGFFLPHGVEELLTDGFFGDEADQALFGGPVFGGWTFAQASINPLTGQQPIYYRGYRANELAAYFQDEWRIHRNLTINLGVRWDYFGPPHNFQKGLDSNFFFGSATPIDVNSANFFGGGDPNCADPTTSRCNPFYPAGGGVYQRVFAGGFQQKDHEIWNKDTNNFAPRVGFAWDVKGNGKLVVRGGYGIAYDRIWNNLFENIRFNAPFFSFATVGTFGNGTPAGPLSTPGLFAVPFTQTERAGFNNPAFQPTPSPRHMDENFVAAYFEQANFGVQWEFAKDFALELNYIGTFGHKLPGVIDINTYDGRTSCPRRTSPAYPAGTPCGDAAALIPFDNTTPGVGMSTRRVTSSIAGDNFRTALGNSNYHGLQATVRKRFSYGLQFNANYTYGKALDFVSDAFGINGRGSALRPTDNMNPRLDYGNADFDIRHRFVASLFYELPFWKKNGILGGWAISSILSAQGGVPVVLFNSAFDTNKDGYFTDRPEFLGTGGLNNARTGNSPANGFFDTAQFQNFACPATDNFGLWCNAPTRRGGLTGPGFRNWDFGVHKKFKVTERLALTYQANFFNILNHPNFAQGPQFGNLNSGNFGKSTATFGDDGGHRIIQMALRLDF